MKQEIRQNGKTVLYSEDGCSIPMIFNNLVGKNLKGREYCESEEYFTDESHKNNWEYLIDGTLFIETA